MSSHTHLDVDILINGKPVKKYNLNGRVFVEAKEGSEYTVKFNNNNLERILVVPSVDGINAIDGEAAGSSNAGYVVNGYNKLEVKGFRTSNQTVNAFKFSKKEKSYAAKSEATDGDTSSCGVIGLKIWNEKPRQFPSFTIKRMIPSPLRTYDPEPVWQSPYVGDVICGGSQTAEFKCCGGIGGDMTSINFLAVSQEQDRGFDMGTEFSKNELEDSVSEVEFETGTHNCTIEIFYASRESLLEMGVPIYPEKNVTFPSAFPKKFCKPPRS